MTEFIFLDSGPPGPLIHPQRVTKWLSRCLLQRSRVIVPAIIYYELKRELLRARKTASIARLDAFVAARPGRYLELTAPGG